jgi:hypothetical protein
MKCAALAALAACGSGGGTPPDAEVCAHIAGAPSAVGTIAGIPSAELSGLAASHTIEKLLWTHGDHGGTADIYAIGATDAAARGSLHLTDVTAIDWEDIATGPCAEGSCIYVADTGDNDLTRATVAIYVVTEPTAAIVGSVAVTASRHDVMYPDGAHNVEAVFVDPRDRKVYGIDKVMSKHAHAYELPLIDGSVGLAQPVIELSIPGDDPRVTAADMTVDACEARIAIRTYGALYELRGSPSAPVATLLGGALASLPVADEPHGEAVAYAADGAAYFTTSEGADPALHRVTD